MWFATPYELCWISSMNNHSIPILANHFLTNAQSCDSFKAKPQDTSSFYWKGLHTRAPLVFGSGAQLLDRAVSYFLPPSFPTSDERKALRSRVIHKVWLTLKRCILFLSCLVYFDTSLILCSTFEFSQLGQMRWRWICIIFNGMILTWAFSRNPPLASWGFLWLLWSLD